MWHRTRRNTQNATYFRVIFLNVSHYYLCDNRQCCVQNYCNYQNVCCVLYKLRGKRATPRRVAHTLIMYKLHVVFQCMRLSPTKDIALHTPFMTLHSAQHNGKLKGINRARQLTVSKRLTCMDCLTRFIDHYSHGVSLGLSNNELFNHTHNECWSASTRE